MSREQASVNAAQHYGPRAANTGLADTVSTYGVTREMELYFDFDQLDLPTSNADDDAGTLFIPAGALIKAAYIEVSTAFASGSPTTDGLAVGFEKTDGTVLDVDGLFATTTTNTDDLAVGWVVGDGALIGASIGTDAGQLSIGVAAGTLTAGKARLVVEYILPTSA